MAEVSEQETAILEQLARLMKHGFGELNITVKEGQIKEYKYIESHRNLK